jgi:hypothetical protein
LRALAVVRRQIWATSVAVESRVVIDDGEEMDYGPGDVGVMAPGHGVRGSSVEPCVVIDWQGFADYAKR